MSTWAAAVTTGQRTDSSPHTTLSEDFRYLLLRYPERGPAGHVFSPATQQLFQRLQFYNNLVQEPPFSYTGKMIKIILLCNANSDILEFQALSGSFF